MIPLEKIYSADISVYEQKTVSQRLEALFLANIGLVVTRDQILAAARDAVTKKEPENWHQRLSELRTDKGYTILSWRDWKALSPQEYVLASIERRQIAAKRVRPSKGCWTKVLTRAKHSCEWREDGQSCGLQEGAIDPIGGGTVKLTPDHVTPHAVDPNSDPENPQQWQALCGRHQVMKKNFWDGATGKVNVLAILQASSIVSNRIQPRPLIASNNGSDSISMKFGDRFGWFFERNQRDARQSQDHLSRSLGLLRRWRCPWRRDDRRVGPRGDAFGRLSGVRHAVGAQP